MINTKISTDKLEILYTPDPLGTIFPNGLLGNLIKWVLSFRSHYTVAVGAVCAAGWGFFRGARLQVTDFVEFLSFWFKVVFMGNTNLSCPRCGSPDRKRDGVVRKSSKEDLGPGKDLESGKDLGPGENLESGKNLGSGENLDAGKGQVAGKNVNAVVEVQRFVCKNCGRSYVANYQKPPVPEDHRAIAARLLILETPPIVVAKALQVSSQWVYLLRSRIKKSSGDDLARILQGGRG